MRFAIIAACDYLSGGIGIAGKLPWYIKADMDYFRSATSGGTVIMGRLTWESIGSTPLPNRHNIIVSSAFPYSPSLDAALALADDTTNVFVIGGRRLFKEALAHPDCDTAYLTFIRPSVVMTYDAFFPLDSLNKNGWTIDHMTEWKEEDDFKYMFTKYFKTSQDLKT